MPITLAGGKVHAVQKVPFTHLHSLYLHGMAWHIKLHQNGTTELYIILRSESRNLALNLGEGVAWDDVARIYMIYYMVSWLANTAVGVGPLSQRNRCVSELVHIKLKAESIQHTYKVEYTQAKDDDGLNHSLY